MDAQRRQQLMDAFVQQVARLGMTTPAILFLEMHKPVAFLGAQMLWVTQPFLSLGFSNADLHDFALLIEDRGNVEELIDRLEAV